ncbi:MAG TPA: tetratricopeptide repeat protein [Allosphingosinicella sp.]
MSETATPTAPSRADRLRSFLEQDPGNARLLADAAAAALDEGEPDAAAQLIGRYGPAPLPPALLNLKGVAALQAGRPADAAEAFEGLVAAGEADPVVRFNLAWARTLTGDHEGALEMLDDGSAEAAPGGPALKIHALHHVGRLEEALETGAGLAERHPEDGALMGALAAVAIDSEDSALARSYAERAGGNDEGLAALGTLELDEGRLEQSLALFGRALEADPGNARANIGMGMGLLARGDGKAAIPFIERGAERFGDHPGSWIAAGWALFLQGDHEGARDRFEKALACDDSFAESHGGLAVVDIAEGDLESGRRRTEIARRLDPNCFSAALAKSLLLEGEGRGPAAEKVRAAAMATPIAPGGKTMAEAIAAIGRRERR